MRLRSLDTRTGGGTSMIRLNNPHVNERIRNLPTVHRSAYLPAATRKVNASWMAWYRTCQLEGLR